MKQPRSYMTAIFSNEKSGWIVAFTMATTKKQAAAMAFDVNEEFRLDQRNSANSLQKYTSLVFRCPKSERYWVRPTNWTWSSELPQALCSGFSPETTTEKEIANPVQALFRFPADREKVVFVGDD